MGFSKNNYSDEIGIVVTHAWHPGEKFGFDFPKLMPQSALDKHKSFLALDEAAEADVYRVALLEVVGALLLREPTGFDDFPGARHVKAIAEEEARFSLDLQADAAQDVRDTNTMLKKELAEIRKETLAFRVVEYFNDPDKPELEAIIVSAWRAYRSAAMPSSYLKSLSSDGAGSGGLSPATGTGQT